MVMLKTNIPENVQHIELLLCWTASIDNAKYCQRFLTRVIEKWFFIVAKLIALFSLQILGFIALVFSIMNTQRVRSSLGRDKGQGQCQIDVTFLPGLVSFTCQVIVLGYRNELLHIWACALCSVVCKVTLEAIPCLSLKTNTLRTFPCYYNSSVVLWELGDRY